MNEGMHIRQTGLIHPSRLNTQILVIGAGGTGSWTVTALSKMGCQNVVCIDHDVVELHNLSSQVYDRADIGRHKVEALRAKLLDFIDLKTTPGEWTPEHGIPSGSIVVSAVDSMKVRKEIYRSSEHSKYLIDPRMARDMIEIYSIPMDDPIKRLDYEKTLFTDEEAEQTLCTERSVVYNTLVISGLITDIIAKISNGDAVPYNLVVDLKNFSMIGGNL